MTEPLSAAIDGLYATFGRLPRPRVIDHCPHCADPGAEPDPLQPVPLRELTVETLRTYAGSAMTTAGTVDDFRYFLPRLLEIASDGDGFAYPDLAAVIGKLGYGRWTTWTQDEQEAVRRYLHALWATTLTRDPDDTHDAGTVLGAIGAVEDDLTPYLEAWDRARDQPPAAAHLAAMLQHGWRVKRGERRLTTPYLTGREAQARQIIAWLDRKSAGSAR